MLSPQPNWSEHTQEENKKRTRSSRFLDRQSNTDHQSGVKNVYTAQNKMLQDIQTPEIQKRRSVEIPSRFFHPQACHNFWYWHGWGLARPGYGWKWATPPVQLVTAGQTWFLTCLNHFGLGKVPPFLVRNHTMSSCWQIAVVIAARTNDTVAGWWPIFHQAWQRILYVYMSIHLYINVYIYILRC